MLGSCVDMPELLASCMNESLDGRTRLRTTSGGKNLTYNFKSSLTQ